ncbi:DUF4214 domain-containing protein [Pseudoduganella lutea]|uniref:DUF4214 domain-containing protein n=1 Tax=Pseudoduganella lutea TaxID=321985 RepID=A0A4P6KUR7_9BURK|nr:DUF4214 domain-containing protein [Pseudoduganella lutea]QBE61848.1 DUF4214 domain-containing protein [Pseudoduganella lutea]
MGPMLHRLGTCCAFVLLCACGGPDAPPASGTRAAASDRHAPRIAERAADYETIVQTIYIGYFGRPPDPAGLAYYARLYAGLGAPTTLADFRSAYSSDPAVRQTIDDMAASQESRDLYPGNNTVFITAIYRNLFNRAPDAAGLAYWAKLLGDGAITRGNAALSIMAGGQASDMVAVQRKVAASVAFVGLLDTPARVAAYAGASPNEAARQLLQRVDAGSDLADLGTAFQALLQSLLAAPRPAGAPGQPVITSAVPTDTQIVLVFAAPQSNGASPIEDYTAICTSPSGVASMNGTASPLIVGGLQNGVPYSCAVNARNGAGTGTVSQVVDVTPQAGALTWQAPVDLVATGLSTSRAGRAFLAFGAPPRIGNTAPPGYLATCAYGGESLSGYATASPVVVEGLRNNVQYTCTVSVAGPEGGVPSSTVPVDIPAPNGHHLRFIYAVPSDRPFNDGWSKAIQGAAVHLQQWFKHQLGGPTFTIYAAAPEVCNLPRPSRDYFSNDTWATVQRDLTEHCGLDHTRQDVDWIVYADVLHAVNTPGRLGAGMPRLAMFPRQDLEGLGGAPCVVSDEGTTYCFETIRWTGGGAHEIAHTLHVPHPEGCDAGLPSCTEHAKASIMWTGYTIYPDTYFLPAAKAILFESPFIR